MSGELHVELLVGREVVDAAGRRVGHIQEFVAQERGSEIVVSEVHVGRYALAERFSITGLGIAFTRFFGGYGFSREPRRFPWEELDFADPERPRLKKRIEEYGTPS